MIERVTRRLLFPSIGSSSRSNLSSHHPLSGRRVLHSSLFHPKHIQCNPKRFYAIPTPELPKEQSRIPSKGEENITPITESHQNDPSRPSFLPPRPDPSSSPRPKRSLRPYIYATIFFIIGASAGKYASMVVAPPPLPAPSTPTDTALTATIHAMAAKLPIVQQLSTDPDWASWDAYSAFTAAEKERSITAGALAGSRGLGAYQRIFRNRGTGEFVSVLWIGGALAGWPGVAHGGLLAIVMDESLARAAIARFPVATGITAKLEMTYKAPTVTNAFCVIRATPVEEGSTDRKSWVRGTLEDMSGKVCVEATGLFVLPKNLDMMKLRSIRLDEGF